VAELEASGEIELMEVALEQKPGLAEMLVSGVETMRCLAVANGLLDPRVGTDTFAYALFLLSRGLKS